MAKNIQSPVVGVPEDVITPNIPPSMPDMQTIRAWAASGNPELEARAQAQINLQEALEKASAKEELKSQNRALSYQVAMSANEAERAKAAEQRMCAAGGHQRPDRKSAINGQKTYDGVIQYTCCRCQKTYIGHGDGPDQLPIAMLGHLEPDAIGGVGLV